MTVGPFQRDAAVDHQQDIAETVQFGKFEGADGDIAFDEDQFGVLEALREAVVLALLPQIRIFGVHHVRKARDEVVDAEARVIGPRCQCGKTGLHDAPGEACLSAPLTRHYPV